VPQLELHSRIEDLFASHPDCPVEWGKLPFHHSQNITVPEIEQVRTVFILCSTIHDLEVEDGRLCWWPGVGGLLRDSLRAGFRHDGKNLPCGESTHARPELLALPSVSIMTTTSLSVVALPHARCRSGGLGVPATR
jgi:hypothetical protein